MLLYFTTNVGRNGTLYPYARIVLADGLLRYDIAHSGGMYTSMYTRNTIA